jgi:hypothetical protein
MIRILLSMLFSSFFFLADYAATIMWVGPSGSNWNNTANWSTANIPGVNDDVVFNTSVVVEMDVIPIVSPFIYLINSLTISSNATVTLSRTQTGGGTRILQVKSINALIPGLKIDNGSTLTMNAANDAGALDYVLDLTGSTNVKGDISGNLFFSGTGVGTGNAYLKIYASATNYSSVVVKSTGVIRYFTNSGNTASAAGNYLTMQSGSVYEINKNGGSLPYGNWDDNSNILITGATTNGNIFFSQSRYGNLQWNCPAMSAATQFISNLSPVTAISLNNFTITNTNGKELRLKTGTSATIYDYTIRGKIDIAPAGILVISGSTVTTSGSGASLHIMGDVSNTGVLKSDGIAGTINDIELNGSVNQKISNGGTFSGAQIEFIMNNASGATLLTPLIIPGSTSSALQLNSGKINTISYLLTMLDNSNYTGGSSSSFVEGPMKKVGDDDFTFPVGKGNIYAPIGFTSTGMATTDAFQAEYFRLNPQTAYGVNYQSPPIHHISYVEYWKLDKVTGNVNIPAKITLAVTANSFAKDLATLYVSRYNSADMQWKSDNVDSKIPGPIIAPYVTGTITSPALSLFGVFTIGTSEPELINPLPVNLVSFNATTMSSRQSRIEWLLADYYSGSLRFEVERSVNGNEFKKISSSDANSFDLRYTFYDSNLPSGKIRYRLKVINEEGLINYSNIVGLTEYSKNIEINFYPNPVTDKAMIKIFSLSAGKVAIEIYDASGKRIRQWQQSLSGGHNFLPLQTTDLSRGLYFISIKTGNDKKVIQFIKQ